MSTKAQNRARLKARRGAERVRGRLKGHFSMIREFHLADLFTLANGASGTGAIFLGMAYISDQRPWLIYAAGGLVIAALVFDVLDGRVARWRHKASAMGRELDSLADVISFGVAPACLAYAIGMSGLWDQLVLLYFVCCGISRLARYNVTATDLSGATGKVRHFEGTPIPTSSLLVLLMVVMTTSGQVGARMWWGAYPLLGYDFHPVVLLFALSGTLMISKTLRISKP